MKKFTTLFITSAFVFFCLSAQATENAQQELLHKYMENEKRPETDCPPNDSCTWNSECFSGEHCLDGCCVEADPWNECWSDFDCWPGKCENGVCVN